jgi:hypothetical protein
LQVFSHQIVLANVHPQAFDKNQNSWKFGMALAKSAINSDFYRGGAWVLMGERSIVFIHFTLTDSINYANSSAEIDKIFDIDLYIRTFVMEVATGNWDGIFNANNYYLYFNPDVNKFQYFRHDLDFSYGVSFLVNMSSLFE